LIKENYSISFKDILFTFDIDAVLMIKKIRLGIFALAL